MTKKPTGVSINARLKKTIEMSEWKLMLRIREQIDDVDLAILRLLGQRFELVKSLLPMKQALSRERGSPFFDPVREEALLKGLVSKNRFGLPHHMIRVVFQAIMTGTKTWFWTQYPEQSAAKIVLIGQTSEAVELHLRHYAQEKALTKLDLDVETRVEEGFRQLQDNPGYYGVVALYADDTKMDESVRDHLKDSRCQKIQTFLENDSVWLLIQFR